MACLALLPLAACGGDDDDSDSGDGGPSATTPADGQVQAKFEKQGGGPEPVLTGPVSRFAPLVTDLPREYNTIPDETFEVGPESTPLVPYFADSNVAAQKLQEWGFQEGYITAFEPLGAMAGVLRGRHYVNVEVFLFSSVDGAKKAYEHFASVVRNTRTAQEVDSRATGNSSSGSRVSAGPVPNSQVPSSHHRYLFRRGNLVGVVQTFGTAAQLKETYAPDYAYIIDQKALGKRNAPQPTPVGGAGPLPTPAR